MKGEINLKTNENPFRLITAVSRKTCASAPALQSHVVPRTVHTRHVVRIIYLYGRNSRVSSSTDEIICV